MMNRGVRKNRKLARVFVCAAAAVCVLAACGKDKPASGQTGRPVSDSGNKEQQTLSNIRVNIRDITAYAGEEIDYIAAIESAENMELNRSMIYVDSSMVDNHTPGIYKAEYTFDYMGTNVTNAVKVTILENKNTVAETTQQETAAVSETTAEETEVQVSETVSAGQETEQETTAAETAASGETTVTEQTSPSVQQTEAPLSTEPVSAVVEQVLPDVTITLTSGKTVTIKMSSSRYITETFTDETYYEEDGFTFLISELKVLFNTGEVQVVETVVTRVQPPETTAETSAAPKE